MNHKVSLQQMIPFLFVLILVAGLAILAPSNVNLPGFQPLSTLFSGPAAAEAATIDPAGAADLSAARWQAMANFYEARGLLTRDPFNYAQAAEASAYRWQAVASAYENLGLLNYHDNPDDLAAYRWLAMADGYARLGLLNNKMDPGEVSAFRWLAIAKGYGKLGLLNSQ